MSVRRSVARLLALTRKRQLDQELDEDIRAHIELAELDAIRSGASPGEARREARLRFGGMEQMKEEHRDGRGIAWLETLGKDFRLGLALLVRAPGFAVTTIVTLALGIGAATATFSVAEAVLLRSLPYPKPEQIVRIWEQGADGHRMNLAKANFDDLRAQNNTFEALAVYGYDIASISGGSEPVRLQCATVSSGFFKVLGVTPALGRWFSAEEHRPYGAAAAIVSYEYWRQYLGATSDLSKRQLRIGGFSYPIVGVMPPGFAFPAEVSVWIASEREPETPSRTAHNWRGIGRLRNGINATQGRADLGAIAQRLRKQYGQEVDLSNAVVVPLGDAMVGDIRSAILILFGAAVLLLLVACANVAGLLVARTSARRQELAVRAALGAGRGRLIQQFLMESFVFCFTGGSLGVLIAALGVKVLPAIIPADLPRQQGIVINLPVLVFALGITVAAALLLGLFAAWRSVAADLRETLVSGSRSYSGSGAIRRTRSFVVIAEIAATVTILAGAGLLGRSFLQLTGTNPGIHSQGLMTVEFSLPDVPTPRQTQLADNILLRVRANPLVQNAALAGALPVAAGDNLADGSFLILNGVPSPRDFNEWGRLALNPSQTGHALYAVADDRYFPLLGIPTVRGRVFTAQDNATSGHVAVISRTLARQQWPNQDPIGQTINFGNMDGNLKPLTIVGIVGDVRARGLDNAASPVIYVDYRQRGLNRNSAPTILIRSTSGRREIVSAVRSILHELAPETPVKFSTFEDEMGGWLADRRFLLSLVGVFAGSALLLAAVGIYGVIAFSVARRTREIGIRMAIGARRSEVLFSVLREGAGMAVAGIAMGILISLAVTRLMAGLLFGIHANDPLTFAAVAMFLLLTALAASYIPARRAMRVDPVMALRYE